MPPGPSKLEFKLLARTSSADRRGAARERRSISLAAHSLQRLLDRLTPEELAFITGQLEKALQAQERRLSRRTAAAAEASVPYVSGHAGDEAAVLLRSFRRRRDLLKDSLGASEVAELLGTSRQTPHDRATSGSLLAILDRGVLRFPAWQFDPAGPDGVIDGLPRVLRALTTSPFGKLSWLLRPSLMLGGRRPLDALRAGTIDRVVVAARAVEAD